MRRYPIGFHLGPGGNPTGIGDYMRRLDAANIAAFIKSADSYGPCYELMEIARTSGVDHTAVFRLSTAGQQDGYDYDVPPYEMAANDAAYAHWQAIIAKLPPEYKYDAFHREHVWLEVINEVDKNRANWLGWFSTRIAKLAVEQGYRIALQSWSPGEPEPKHWLEAGMVAFLNYAANHPNRVAVSLHEYSLNQDEIWTDHPWLIGRFETLNAACDGLGISRPTILITEWGWTYNTLPSVVWGMPQLEEVAAYYYDHKNILGAGLWYLGPGFQNIADKAQKYIAPVTEAALSFPYEEQMPNCIEVSQSTKIHLLRPVNLSDNQWGMVKSLMTSGVNLPDGRHVIIGYEGWSHEDAIKAIRDAVMAGFTDSRLVVMDGSQIGTGLDAAWMAANCPLLSPYTVFISSGSQPPVEPPATPARLGLHASADPALANGEVAMMRTARVEAIKILSNMRKEDVSTLSSNFPGIPFVIRAFLDWGGRNVTPQQFFDWTYPDVREIVSRLGSREIWVELHNEPNLVQEGWTLSWSNGTSFSGWFNQLIALYRQSLGGVSFLFPGLSPGGDVAGIRYDSWRFLAEATSAINLSDGVAMHTYWAANWPMATALGEVDRYVSAVHGKPIWVTEASNNKSDTSQEAKGAQYIQFSREIGGKANVRGVTYFVASASNPAWGWQSGSGEIWLGTAIPVVVGSRT